MNLEDLLATLKEKALEGPPSIEPQINETIDVDRQSLHDRLTFSSQCVWCHGWTIFHVDRDKYNRYIRGEHVDRVWPDLSKGHRETIVSGTHGSCFDDMFKGMN